MKELAIGEIGEIDGVKVRCVEHEYRTLDCLRCCFDEMTCQRNRLCQKSIRKDNKHVYYEKVKS